MASIYKDTSRRHLIGALMAMGLTPPAFSATWPVKPITLYVGYAPGGSVDAMARLVQPELAKRLGQPVVIENIGGAGGTIGAARAARAPTDGYTFLVGSGSEVAIAWAVNPSLKYNGLKDFAPVGLISSSTLVLVGNPSVPAKDFASLIQYSKANRDKLSLATSGVGTPQHLLLEYINNKTGGEILHVPYRSASTIVQDVIGGRVDLSLLTLSTALPFVQSGKLRAYAITTEASEPSLPGIPSISSLPELKGESFDVWFGLLAPTGTPSHVIERMNSELNSVLQLPEVQAGLRKQAMHVVPGTSSQFSDFVKKDSAKYQRIVKESKIVVN